MRMAVTAHCTQLDRTGQNRDPTRPDLTCPDIPDRWEQKTSSLLQLTAGHPTNDTTGERITVVAHVPGTVMPRLWPRVVVAPVDGGAGDAEQFRQLLRGVGPIIVEFEQVVAL